MESSEVRIENWQYGKRAAVTITLDDWTPGHRHVALPLLDDFGLPATFFLPLHNLGLEPNFDHWGCFQKMLRDGHELGNHSRSHCDLRGLPPSRLYEEIAYPREQMLHHLCRPTIQSYCYPFGEFDGAAVDEVAKEHLGARAVRHSPEDLTFEYDFTESDRDYYNVATLRVNSDLNGAALEHWLDKLVSRGGLMPMMVHGVYDDSNKQDINHWDAIHRDQLGELLTRVRDRAEDLWITTFGEAIRYHRLVRGSSCQVESSDGYTQRLGLDVDVSWENSAGTRLTLSLERKSALAVRAIVQDGTSLDFRETSVGYGFEARAICSHIDVVWG